MKKIFQIAMLTSFSIMSLNASAAKIEYSGVPDEINCSWECSDGTTDQGWEATAGDCQARADASCGDKVTSLNFGNLLQNSSAVAAPESIREPIKEDPKDVGIENAKASEIEVLVEGKKLKTGLFLIQSPSCK